MAELRYLSSRGGAPPLTLSEAIRQGLAPDGGLYVPTRLPEVEVAAVARATRETMCSKLEVPNVEQRP